jgi:cytochrome P450
MMPPPLPPGPRLPRALQTLAWTVRPEELLERCHARYGDMFTLTIAHEGTWVMLAHPDLVQEVFTGDPRVLHAGHLRQTQGSSQGDDPLAGRS